jgi:hypothetical protein
MSVARDSSTVLAAHALGNTALNKYLNTVTTFRYFHYDHVSEGYSRVCCSKCTRILEQVGSTDAFT